MVCCSKLEVSNAVFSQYSGTIWLTHWYYQKMWRARYTRCLLSLLCLCVFVAAKPFSEIKFFSLLWQTRIHVLLYIEDVDVTTCLHCVAMTVRQKSTQQWLQCKRKKNTLKVRWVQPCFTIEWKHGLRCASRFYFRTFYFYFIHYICCWILNKCTFFWKYFWKLLSFIFSVLY